MQALGPPVRLVRLPGDEARGAELIQQAHQGGAFDPHGLGQRGLPDARAARDEDQRQGGCLRKPVRPHHGIGKAAPLAGRLHEIEAIGLKVVRGHRRPTAANAHRRAAHDG